MIAHSFGHSHAAGKSPVFSDLDIVADIFVSNLVFVTVNFLRVIYSTGAVFG